MYRTVPAQCSSPCGAGPPAQQVGWRTRTPGPDVRGDRTREQNRMECAPGVLSLKSTFRCFFRLGVMAYAKLYRLLRKRFYVYIRSFTQTLTYTKLHGLTTLNSQVLTVP